MNYEPKIHERGSTHVYKVKKITKEEFEEISALCTAGEPPFCNAACPLKLDAKAMLAAAASGDFDRALQIYEKAVPFPVLMCEGCSAPCRKKCRLNEIGDGVDIKAVERAIVEYGRRKKSGGVFRMKKKKTAAVFGTDLFCLFLAGELEKKMYPLTVYTEAADINEFAAMTGAGSELERIKDLDVSFVFKAEFSRELFESECPKYDVCCLSAINAGIAFEAPECDERYMLCTGTKTVMGIEADMLGSAFAAKKAALTVDRLVQNLSPDNMRGTEGAVESSLYTNLKDAKALRRVERNGAYSKEEATEEAKRCIQCHCDECKRGCAFLADYDKTPGEMAHEIFNNTQIIMGNHPLNRVMNSCSVCGQCKITCPNGFDMSKVCKTARENMVSTDKLSLAVHEFALLDMLFSNDEAFLCRPQPGYDKCRYVFFPGCQTSAIAPATVKAAYEDLCSRLEGGVALMLGCCGAICDWAGRFEMYDEVRQKLDSELEKLGNPIVIAGCPTCKKQLERHNPIGIWDILGEIGLPDTVKKQSGSFAMHDSCGARGDRATQNAIRDIAGKLGCSLVDTEYSGDRSSCCGYGGLTQYTNPEMAGKMADRCVETDGVPYISYCMACRDRLARQGTESMHILELVYGEAASTAPDINEKRFNRLALKEELLKTLWKEETEKMQYDFEIQYAPGAEETLDRRMILKSDVEAVMLKLRETGSAVYDSESGHCTTCCRVGNVTFWVVYDETENGYLVLNAYSHRMTVEVREVEQ